MEGEKPVKAALLSNFTIVKTGTPTRCWPIMEPCRLSPKMSLQMIRIWGLYPIIPIAYWLWFTPRGVSKLLPRTSPVRCIFATRAVTWHWRKPKVCHRVSWDGMLEVCKTLSATAVLKLDGPRNVLWTSRSVCIPQLSSPPILLVFVLSLLPAWT